MVTAVVVTTGAAVVMTGVEELLVPLAGCESDHCGVLLPGATVESAGTRVVSEGVGWESSGITVEPSGATVAELLSGVVLSSGSTGGAVVSPTVSAVASSAGVVSVSVTAPSVTDGSESAIASSEPQVTSSSRMTASVNVSLRVRSERVFIKSP